MGDLLRLVRGWCSLRRCGRGNAALLAGSGSCGSASFLFAGVSDEFINELFRGEKVAGDPEQETDWSYIICF